MEHGSLFLPRSLRCFSRHCFVAGGVLLFWLLSSSACELAGETATVQPDIALIVEHAANPERSKDLAAAWRRLVDAGPSQLPSLFAAASSADPVATNWLLSAADRIVKQEHQAGRKLGLDHLTPLVTTPSYPGPGRWWAWQWLSQEDPSQAKNILADCLDDPAAELRRAAIAAALDALGDLNQVLASAESPQRVATLQQLQKLFQLARDKDQVEQIAEWLRRFGQEVDLARHYGYLRVWYVIGPFDNTGDRGFATEYPPEQQGPSPDLQATFEGKHGPVRWKKVTTTDPAGNLDLNQAIAEEKGVVAYAAAEIILQTPQPAEVRVATPNALKIFVNGQPKAAFLVYHSGFEDDQYRVPCQLHAGSNWIMLKVCQNEQMQDWAHPWVFRARVCDALGGGVGEQPP